MRPAKRELTAQEKKRKVSTGHVSLVKLLESIRISEQWSQTKMAQTLGISVGHLHNILNGRKSVTIESAVRFAKVLRCDQMKLVTLALQSILDQEGLRYRVMLFDEEKE